MAILKKPKTLDYGGIGYFDGPQKTPNGIEVGIFRDDVNRRTTTGDIWKYASQKYIEEFIARPMLVQDGRYGITKPDMG